MVQIASLNLPDSPPKPVVLTQDKFDRGVIDIIDDTKLPKNALKDAINSFLDEDGAPRVRPGLEGYGTEINGYPIDGGGFYIDGYTVGSTPHIIAVANGTIYRSVNDGASWAACTGATFTAGKKVETLLVNNVLYIFNGYDYVVRYNGTTTLQVYSGISAPSGNTPSKTGLGGTTIYTLRYRVSAVNDVGYTEASVAQTIGVDRTRDAFDSSNFITFTWNTVTGATRYDIYVGEIAGEETYIGSVEGAATVTFQDKGQPQQVNSVAPNSNTTQGPRVGQMEFIGSRVYATQDRDYPYRVWISGAGRYIGQFSSAYDATYVDLQIGSQYKPVIVKDYRDGKGTPLATVWCDSVDGLGCVWQGTLESYTIGDVTFPVPNFYKLPGSRGTSAPRSVVNVLNDYMYYNLQAYFNLGSRAQFLNLLSTDESSANIRNSLKKINPKAANGICSFFKDAKVYFSVPINSDVNNTTTIYDTERKAWLPQAFDKGFEKIFAYTTTTGDNIILAWKPGDTKFTRIGDDIRGDYGQPINVSIQTGLMHVNPRNRFDFMWAEEAEVELSDPAGTIGIELSGITREEGFKKIIEKTISPDRQKYSWSTAVWTSKVWTDTTTVVVSYSEPSMKRYFSVQEDINAYQYRIYGSAIDTKFTLRTLQITGTSTQAGKPAEWELE